MRVTLEPYLSQFDVEKLEIASVIGICGSLVGPKSGNVEKVFVFKSSFERSIGFETASRTNDGASRTVWEGVGGG